MKTLIIVLIIASFLQTTILPIDLVLLILICRAYIRSGKANLYLAFAFGLLISHLNLGLWGLQSITFITIIQITQMLSKSRFAGNPYLIVPVSFVMLFPQSFQIQKALLESLLSLPLLYLLRLWEERFIPQKGIRLKM